MMTYLKNFLLFWYDFMVGDDWMIAAGVLMALVVSVALARRGLNAWWVMLVTVVVLLAALLWRETRRTRSRNSAQRGAI
jgi:membrane protein implicated in regulation of membrane protease activity